MSAFAFNAIKQSSIPQQKWFDGRPFPLVYTPSVENSSRDTLTEWINANRDDFLRDIFNYKAVLLRGFNLLTAHDFHEVVEATGLSGSKQMFNNCNII